MLQGYEINLQTQCDAAMQLVHAQDYSNRNLLLLQIVQVITKCSAYLNNEDHACDETRVQRDRVSAADCCVGREMSFHAGERGNQSQ